MIEKSKLNKIISFAKKYHPKNTPHEFDHILSVVAVARFLAKKEKANRDVVTVAGYLHDIGYAKGTKDNHNQKSVEMSSPLLKRLGFSDKFISKVSHTILHHKTSWAKKTRKKEGRILCDADKIDQLGAHGFLRVVKNRLLYRKEDLSEAVKKAEEKNKEIYDNLFTKSAKIMVKKECDYIKTLCKDFDKRKRLIESI